MGSTDSPVRGWYGKWGTNLGGLACQPGEQRICAQQASLEYTDDLLPMDRGESPWSARNPRCIYGLKKIPIGIFNIGISSVVKTFLKLPPQAA